MPPFSQDFSLGFSSSLVETLIVSRSKVDAFIEAQKAIIDSQVIAHNNRVSQEQALIDEQANTLMALRLQRGVHDTDTIPKGLVHRKTGLMTQQQKLKEQIITLQQKRAIQQKDLKDLKNKEAEHQLRAAEARDMKVKVEESKKTTVEDLTRGIVNYKYLGLDFEKAEDNRLRFTFTQLDAGEPSRPFSFQLHVNEQEIYEVDNCQPDIPSSALTKMTDDLNESDDLSSFVRDMRDAFSTTV